MCEDQASGKVITEEGYSSAMTHFPFYALVSSSFLVMPTNHIYIHTTFIEMVFVVL